MLRIRLCLLALLAYTSGSSPAQIDAHGWPTGNAPSVLAPPSVSCEFVRGYCRIGRNHPLPGVIPRSKIFQTGANIGMVTPQAYAEAYAGRPVTITKMSFVPMRDGGTQASIEWR